MTELREKLIALIDEHVIPVSMSDCWLEDQEEAADAILALIQKEQRWQPIESAPRDGTDILVFCEDSGEQFVGFNNPAEGSDREDVFFTALLKSGKRVGCIPSHWQPLPTPPQGEDG